jgi:hypothetical protein
LLRSGFTPANRGRADGELGSMAGGSAKQGNAEWAVEAARHASLARELNRGAGRRSPWRARHTRRGGGGTPS